MGYVDDRMKSLNKRALFPRNDIGATLYKEEWRRYTTTGESPPSSSSSPSRNSQTAEKPIVLAIIGPQWVMTRERRKVCGEQPLTIVRLYVLYVLHPLEMSLLESLYDPRTGDKVSVYRVPTIRGNRSKRIAFFPDLLTVNNMFFCSVDSSESWGLESE